MMNWRSIVASIGGTAHAVPAAEQDSSIYERFAVPYKFQPRLSVMDAAAFALRAFVRILLGSILFGAWGASTMLAWTSIHNPFARAVAVMSLFVLFLALMAGMTIATRRSSFQRRRT
jgi:hypothetical protein